MNKYLKIDWTEAKSLEDPVVFYHEVGDDQWEKRRVEVFADGKLGHSSLIEPENRTSLSWEPFAEVEDIDSPEFRVHEIAPEEFESVWERALGEAPPVRPDQYLPQWFTVNRERLQGLGLDERISASDGTGSLPKRSVRIDLDSLERAGRVTCWSTGEADLEVVERATEKLVASEHFELKNQAEAEQVLEKLVEIVSNRPSDGPLA